jgi:hypothetical protein
MPIKLKLLILLIFIVVVSSCRKKISADYNYYQPYRKDSLSIAKQKISKLDSISIKIPEIKPGEFPPVDVTDKYFIVIASFSVEQYALAMKSEMEQLGFKPEIIVVDNDGWNKLAITSYNNFDEASKALILVRQNQGRFSDARLVVK